METIRGRTSLTMDYQEWRERTAGYSRIVLDLGTGDGRYARSLAEAQPSWFITGVDTCRENLHRHSQAGLPNLLFVIASAQHLPAELEGLVSQVSINFPWGSLLQSLLTGDPRLLCGLDAISRAGTSLALRLNGRALAEAGTGLAAGIERIQKHLWATGWQLEPPAPMDAREMKAFPSTWAKRLAFGRDPRAVLLRGCK